MQNDKSYSICYLAGREKSYSRTQVVLQALQSRGHVVFPMIPPDKSFRHYPKLCLRFLLAYPKCDLIIIGFYGHFLILFARLFARKPILFDALVSTFFVMRDRGKSRNGIKDRIYYLLDKLAMAAADKIVLESDDHTAARARVFHLPPQLFQRIYLPTNDAVFRPMNCKKKQSPFLVHFHGEFAPFHGVRYILDAAKILEGQNVKFRIIGSGITAAEDRKHAASLDLHNVEFIERVSFELLPQLMAEASVCLGIFGDTVRTLHELTNKVIEAMALGAAIITAQNAPVQELLQHEKSAILIPPANAQALADAILRLQADEKLREKIGKTAREIYLQKCSMDNFTREFNAVIDTLLARQGKR